MRRRVSTIVAIHGILRAGGAYVPIEPTYPADRIAFIIEDSQMATVVTEARMSADLPVADGVENVVLYDEFMASSIRRGPAPPVDSGVRPDNLAYVIYTSGTTGRPKGVLVEHRGLVNDIWYVGTQMVPQGDFRLT